MSRVLVHLHGFKCAGSTFTWILEKNFPNKVLYVESLINNSRLDFKKVTSLVEKGKFEAVSSHLISPPPLDSDLSPVVITFLRNPTERLISAYEFQKSTNSLKEGDVNFRAFLTRLRLSIVSNYQTRLLSPQAWDVDGARNGWDLNPRAIDLDDKNLFVGTVEMFDQSLVLLEEWLKERNLEFDGSYGLPTNTGSRTGLKKPDFFTDSVFPDMIEVDELLWKEASRRIKSKISSDLNFKDKMADFERRREAVTGLQIPQKGPEDFVRL